jgi:NADPH-dependent glutamate synthase beta subunit-like oxidoreductase
MKLGEPDASGRRSPVPVEGKTETIDVDTVILAIGQAVNAEAFDLDKTRKGAIAYDPETYMTSIPGVFAGGDCVTGPATVIRAIAAGKAAAANIDEYLGFHHEITTDVQLPAPVFKDLRARGRINISERDAMERKGDFECIECGYTDEEAFKESGRCLRCDHFGFGNFRGGRVEKW